MTITSGMVAVKQPTQGGISSKPKKRKKSKSKKKK